METINYPPCGSPDHPCCGILVPVEREVHTPGMRVGTWVLVNQKVWKCTICGREVK